MLRFDIARAIAFGVSALLLSACHAQGPTQAASQNAAEQSAAGNPSVAPDATSGPMEAGTHYIARTDPKTHGVVFTIGANGLPGAATDKGATGLDLHTYMHSGPNNVVVKWERQSKGGAGAVKIQTSAGKQVAVVTVTPSMPDKGQKTIAINVK